MQCPPIFDDNGRPVKLPQETIYADLSNGIRDLSNVHPPFKPHRHGPGQIPPTASVAATPVPVTISGHVWSDNLPPTTFVTATVRAAKDEKGVAPDDFDSSEVLTAMAEEDVASVVDKHKKTTQTTSTYIFTPHVTGSAFIGWCGAPGTSCNEKDIVPDDYDSSNVITTASNSEKTLNATAVPSPTANSTLALATSAPALKVREAAFVPSLVRFCDKPDLVDCYHPLAPDVADDPQHAATSSSTTIPWAATTLASYASNSWDGAPPDTLATYAGNTWAGQPPPPKRDGSVFPTGSVSPSGDCELPGYCAEELSEES